MTPLMLAATKDCEDCVRLLLKNGADKRTKVTFFLLALGDQMQTNDKRSA